MGRLTRLQPFARNLSPRKPLWTFCATKISRSYFHNPMRWSAMNNLIKSILKTAVYFLDQTDRFAVDLRDRVSDTVDRAADRVSDRVSDLRPGSRALRGRRPYHAQCAHVRRGSGGWRRRGNVAGSGERRRNSRLNRKQGSGYRRPGAEPFLVSVADTEKPDWHGRHLSS